MYVYSGADGSLIYATLGCSFGEYGGFLNKAGDVNGDGAPDFIAGGKKNQGVGKVGVGVFSVRSGADGSSLYFDVGKDGGDQLGKSLSSIDDLNGDGVPEIIVGAPFAQLGYWNDAGYVVVLSGSDGSLIYQLAGSADEAFGTAID